VGETTSGEAASGWASGSAAEGGTEAAGEAVPDRRVLAITGEDRASFLQGLVTNDVDRISGGGLVYAAMLTPQGRYLADFFLLERDAAILLDVHESRAEALAQRLGMYKLRSRVEIGETSLFVQRGQDKGAGMPADASADPRHPGLGWRRYTAAAGTPAHTDWDALRVALAVPEAGRELFEESYILEMGFERLGGVDFRKGCYVGQEVTARMKHKTELRKGLARVSVDGHAEEGSTITVAEKPAGQLCTVAGGEALAYLRFDRAQQGEMTAGTAILRLMEAP
jgi:hypothetical protein